MGHNVGDAADRAVKRSERRTEEQKTPEQRIAEMRRNLASVPPLFNPPQEQRFLLEQFDVTVAVNLQFHQQVENLQEALSTASQTILKLTEENIQFRTVYEQENSSRGTVTVVADAPAPEVQS